MKMIRRVIQNAFIARSYMNNNSSERLGMMDNANTLFALSQMGRGLFFELLQTTNHRKYSQPMGGGNALNKWCRKVTDVQIEHRQALKQRSKPTGDVLSNHNLAQNQE